MSCILSSLEENEPKICLPNIMKRGAGVIESVVDDIFFEEAEDGAILEEADNEIIYMAMNEEVQANEEDMELSGNKNITEGSISTRNINDNGIEAVQNLSLGEYPDLEYGKVIDSGTYAVGSYEPSQGPLLITGDVHLSLGTEEIIVTSVEDASMTLSAANDTDGNTVSVSGSIIHAEADSTGDDHIYLENANISSELEVLVDINFDLSSVGGTGKISDMAPEEILTNQPPTTYIHTGAGIDKIKGTEANDFIRGGADNDVIDAGAGDDIVRVGSGSDIATLGPGDDVIYVTIDQLDGGSNTITDFSSNGDDKIVIDQSIEEGISISGQGSKLIIISSSGNEVTTTTTFESGEDGQIIEDDDIMFL